MQVGPILSNYSYLGIPIPGVVLHFKFKEEKVRLDYITHRNRNNELINANIDTAVNKLILFCHKSVFYRVYIMNSLHTVRILR